MAPPAPTPGHDEIVVAPPAAEYLCNSREHARTGVVAEVVVTFGELGTRWQKDALWQGNWGRSFALCRRCWGAIRVVAQERRPGLVVTEISLPVALS
jgi:hypothetical protein